MSSSTSCPSSLTHVNAFCLFFHFCKRLHICSLGLIVFLKIKFLFWRGVEREKLPLTIWGLTVTKNRKAVWQHQTAQKFQHHDPFVSWHPQYLSRNTFHSTSLSNGCFHIFPPITWLLPSLNKPHTTNVISLFTLTKGSHPKCQLH